MKNYLKYVILAAIPIIWIIVGVVIIKTDESPNVVKFNAGVIKGYENQPATYEVEASPSYRWSHGTGGTWKVILGVVLSLIGAFLVYFGEEDPMAPEWISKVRWVLIAVFWAAAILTVFYEHANKHDGLHYTKRIDEATYQQYKGDLDKLFVE